MQVLGPYFHKIAKRNITKRKTCIQAFSGGLLSNVFPSSSSFASTCSNIVLVWSEKGPEVSIMENMIQNRKNIFDKNWKLFIINWVKYFYTKKGANYETKKVCYRCQFSKNMCIMSRIHPFKIPILSYFVALKTLENIVSSVVSYMSLLHIKTKS